MSAAQPVISMICNVSKLQTADGSMAGVLSAQMPGKSLATNLRYDPGSRTIADGLLKIAQICDTAIIAPSGIVAPEQGN